ncbi:TrlF family AAA-like ATPase [Sodaliphilus pleomorphus]|uniref:TrlF family AAA-like ATPase n=1 Tax=Sodaliphilus pleomorphus TaxID=2606626 RepID=UPI0024092868|nr:AAA family ATPase [Sodaliphilus pleomorphus]MDD6687316.1 AAA family ATPase [Sodaliphilus pleomorphus]
MSQGALFYKADLHIHSYGVGTGSYDVTDMTNTPQAIVDLAISKGLKVISITDHNQWLNSMAAVQYAVDKDILVVPGIEVSTTQGHLLTYFETVDLLQQFYGSLTFNADKSICNQSIVECLQRTEQLGGIGVLAHITLDSGFEKTIGRFGPHMEAIFQCRCLMGLEITRKEDAGLYTDADDSTDHKHLLEVWRGVNDNKLHRDFAKLMSSDSHELAKLGNNINGNNRLTRIKMASLTFRSFKLAFLSSESRVRLEDYLPEQRPIITHVKLEGELLDGVDIELSPNLTCIIGSRGAGKSTLLESIRETTGDESKSKLRDSDVWPQTALIDYIDEAGQHLQLQRDKHGSVVNRTDPTQGITSIPIESYGQGDTANTIQHSDENPQVIIDFLDSFLSLSALKQQDDLFVEQLRSNQSEMNKLRVNLIALPAAQKNLENEKAKLKKLEQTKAADIVKYHNALIQERELRKSLIGDLKELVKTYSEILANRDVFDKVAAISEENIVVGKDFFANVKAIVDSFAGIVAAKSQELKEALKLKVDELNVQLQAWNSKEKEIQDKIDAKKEELTKQGIPFDLGQINQISKDIVDYDKTVKKLLDDQKKLKELQASRKSLISARIDNKKEITRQHLLFADKINRDLRNSVDDFFITVRYKENLHAPDFADCLKQMMGWRTSQVPKANIIAQSITLFDFIKAVCNNDYAPLRAIQYNGSQLLNDGDIAAIFQTLRQDFQYESLECLRFDDLPQIIVTKYVDTGGVREPIIRRISHLSLGQQQSVLLGILLLSDSTKPLLIDQPEDNLDSEFIYKTIVKTLRKIKEQRQVIIVTHNPNIAVLGDAELIIPLKSTNNKAMIISSGSIDNSDTVKLCCQILEGGESAFKQRQEIYGF